MKKFVFILCALLTGAVAFAFEPNEKVLRSFNETFTNAEEVKWTEYEKYFTVHFVSGGIRAKVNYDKEGVMLGSTRYYKPELLPLKIFNQIRKEFPKKTMFGVTEITVNNEVKYYVKLEDAKTWVTVQVDETGNTSIFEKYKKG